MNTNVEIVRASYDALRAGDVPAMLRYVSPDVRGHQSPALPWGGDFEGHDGFLRFVRGVHDHLASSVAIQRIVDADEKVAVVGWTEGTVRGSGAPFHAPLVHLYTLREGLIVGFEILVDVPTFRAVLGGG